MKKLTTVGLVAIAMAACSVPAYAATDLGTTDLTGADAVPADPNLFYAQFQFTAPPGTLAADATGFTKTYTFNFPTAGIGAGSATASLVGGANTIFKSVTLNGAAFGLSAGNTQALLTSALVNAGVNTLQINFDIIDVAAVAGFQGDVSAAVPEPATWGLMILGFGLVGGALRRRRQKVSVRYA